MSMHKADKLLLGKAGHILAEECANDLEAHKAGSAVHRPELDQQLQALITGATRRERRARQKRILRRVAAIFLVCGFTLSLLFVTVEAFRVTVLNLIVRETEQYANYSGLYTDEEIIAAGFRFFPMEPPAGYSLVGLEMHRTRSRAVFSSLEGHTIMFQQVNQGQSIGIDNEVDAILEVELGGGVTGYFTAKDGAYTLNWKEDVYHFILTGTDAVSQDEIINMAQSVKKIVLL